MYKKSDLDYLREFIVVAVQSDATRMKVLADTYRKMLTSTKNQKSFDELVNNFQGIVSGNKIISKITGGRSKAIATAVEGFYRRAGYTVIYTHQDINRLASSEAGLLAQGKIPPEIQEKTDAINALTKQVKELQKTNKTLKTDLEQRDKQLQAAVKNLHNLEVSVQNVYGISQTQINQWKEKQAPKVEKSQNQSKEKGIKL